MTLSYEKQAVFRTISQLPSGLLSMPHMLEGRPEAEYMVSKLLTPMRTSS
jgi:hypothetical protein